MKGILKIVILSAVSLWITSKILTGVTFDSFLTFAIASLVFGLINIFIRPILKVLTFPINFVTLGLFSAVINVGLLYLTTLIVPGFKISAFYFGGFTLPGIIIPPTHISAFWAAVLASAFIGFFLTTLAWIFS